MSLEIVGLTYHYGRVEALNQLDLIVNDGELLVVLGPSGSGKTTLLGLLAGILTPTAGQIRLNGRELSKAGYALPPEDRNVGFVFQDFALWPHMTVGQTVAFPLKMQHLSARARAQRVEELLSLMRLEGYEGRYPHELSGGQRQRVAIARALAPHPGFILLDEPMSNLDALLRERMRMEVVEVLRHEGVTAVYVTHDRLEALALADRIAILESGRLIEVGPPQDLYQSPGTAFVANFLGTTTLIPARVLARTNSARAVLELSLGITLEAEVPPNVPVGQEGTWLVRPEHVHIVEHDRPSEGGVTVDARVRSASYQGSHWQLELEAIKWTEILFVCHHPRPVASGQKVQLVIDPLRARFLSSV